MQTSIIDAIVTMAEANGLPPESVKVLRRVCSGKHNEKPIPITGKEAREILGRADGRLVSRPYLRSLVEAGKLKQFRLSSRKIRYDKNEVENLLINNGELSPERSIKNA